MGLARTCLDSQQACLPLLWTNACVYGICLPILIHKLDKLKGLIQVASHILYNHIDRKVWEVMLKKTAIDLKKV